MWFLRGFFDAFAGCYEGTVRCIFCYVFSHFVPLR